MTREEMLALAIQVHNGLIEEMTLLKKIRMEIPAAEVLAKASKLAEAKKAIDLLIAALKNPPNVG